MRYKTSVLVTILIAFFVVISAPQVSAVSKFDTVSERINTDLSQIDGFLKESNNPNLSTTEFLADIDKLDSRLQRSLEMYHDLTDFSDPALANIEPEIKELTHNIEGVHLAVVDLRQGIVAHDRVTYERGVKQLDNSLNSIDATMAKIQEKAHEDRNRDAQTELLYIVGTIVSTATAIALYVRSRRAQTTEKMKHKAAAYLALFRQALAPTIGFIITLASFEYAKYTNGTSYTIFTGLMLVGIVYFAISSYKYWFKVRPAIEKMA